MHGLCGREITRFRIFCVENQGFLRRNSLQGHQNKQNMEELRMKLRIAVITILCTGLVCSGSMLSNQANAQGNKPVVMPEITVLNPMGTPPPITLVPQAPRLDTLNGKTIYLINTGYIGTDRFMDELAKWFKANYPKTNIVMKDNRSGAGLSSLSDALWAEIAEKGDASIVGLGH
jgi:hypothetical protein